ACCCPVAAGTRCNITTECLEHERCSSGWRRYGRVHVLALQGCLSPELCGSNQTLTHKGLEYEITYTCCCRDLCNTAAAPESLLILLILFLPLSLKLVFSLETDEPL
uniref:Uncharacterized protein n=2 Tax=Cyprinus carpio TaxID=7962 RepID=A0A8C1DY53_CYPCA